MRTGRRAVRAAFLAAQGECELQQLLGLRHIFGGQYAGHAEIDFGEVVNRDSGLQWLGGERFRSILRHGGRGLVLRGRGFFAGFDHGLHLLGFHAFE